MDWEYLCVNNYNIQKAVAIPYVPIKEVFIMAQTIYPRVQDMLYFSELLGYLNSSIYNENLFWEPFGYDGTATTVYKIDNYIVVRDNLNPIKAEDFKYVEVPYVLLDGKPTLNSNNPMDVDELYQTVSTQLMFTREGRLIEEMGDAYFSSDKKIDFKSLRLELDELYKTGDFEFEGIRVQTNFVAKTYEEFCTLFPNYVNSKDIEDNSP